MFKWLSAFLILETCSTLMQKYLIFIKCIVIIILPIKIQFDNNLPIFIKKNETIHRIYWAIFMGYNNKDIINSI